MAFTCTGIALAHLLGMSDPKPTRGFSEAEEAFFQAGAAYSDPEPAESFGDLDEGYRPPSLLRRLFARKQTHR